ncbi:PREDICTED: tripartite motif-containing protein 45 [Dipodomys ordii]|uniref:RING-type E3 ubiquitin transferase n=1 Tax=Dipodomys ordii TaxID=10020 RepID=A0A1S3FU53_DIPOR|nr:PREDICTED: tripartite motif-containing protein 45 [Dipodomys ordii]
MVPALRGALRAGPDPREPALAPLSPPPRGPTPVDAVKTHCPSCLGLFRVPRLLPCLHTVCTACLEKLEPFSVGDADAGSEGLAPLPLGPRVGILCPVCEAQVDLPAGGVQALTIDHLALSDVLLESRGGDGPGPAACDLCGAAGADKRCQTCGVSLCPFCCQAHRRQKRTADHTVVDLDARAGKPEPCPTHPAEELRLFCELCERPVCGTCAAGEHLGTRPAGHPHIRFCPQEAAGQCRGFPVYGALDAQEVDPARCTLQGEDLHRAREKQTASFTLLCKDAAGESLSRGGDHISVAVVPKDKKDSPVRTVVQDNKDGTYNVSYTPKEPGIYTVWVCVEEQHVQGSPFTVTVKKRHHAHSGVFHCCTFCSSGGQKAVRCACGGTMPGGYLGCGHGHKGHPGRPHWSCCGKFAEKSECTYVVGPGTPGNLLRTVAL